MILKSKPVVMGAVCLILLLIALRFFERNRLFLQSSASSGQSENNYYCPMHSQIQADKPGVCPICNMNLVKKEAKAKKSESVKTQTSPLYYCPMHPQIQSDKPGVCPICNMNLVKKESSPEAQKTNEKKAKDICYFHDCHKKSGGKPCPMMVVTKPGEKVHCPICGTFIAGEEGLIPMEEAKPEGYASIILSDQKRQLIGLKTVAVKSEKISKRVRAAGTIAHDPELYQAQSEYVQAIQALERAKTSSLPEIVNQAERLVDSARIRLRHLGLNDDLIEEFAKGKQAEHNLLYAHPGNPMWMYAQVFEYEIPLIKTGQKVTAEVVSLPNEVFVGTVRSIDAMVDPTTRTTRIRALLDDPDGHLKPDMYVNAFIDIDLEETLVVPQEAVFNTGVKKIVFVEGEEGVLDPREVSLGQTSGNQVQILHGVKEGDKVVSNGNFLVDSESRLQAALEGMGTPAPESSGTVEQHQH